VTASGIPFSGQLCGMVCHSRSASKSLMRSFPEVPKYNSAYLEPSVLLLDTAIVFHGTRKSFSKGPNNFMMSTLRPEGQGLNVRTPCIETSPTIPTFALEDSESLFIRSVWEHPHQGIPARDEAEYHRNKQPDKGKESDETGGCRH
jgi:hypothetical protein